MTLYKLIYAGILTLLCACANGEFSGTIVGNPGLDALRIASGEDIRTESATVWVDVVRWTDCDGGGQDIDWGEQVDLLTNRDLRIPRGIWCEAQVVFDGTLQLEGEADLPRGPRPVSLAVELDTAVIRAQDGFEIRAAPMVLELAFPDWFSVGDLVLRDEALTLHAGDDHHDRLSAVVAVASGMFRDADDDGMLGDDERTEGAVAQGARRPQP